MDVETPVPNDHVDVDGQMAEIPGNAGGDRTRCLKHAFIMLIWVCAAIIVVTLLVVIGFSVGYSYNVILATIIGGISVILSKIFEKVAEKLFINYAGRTFNSPQTRCERIMRWTVSGCILLLTPLAVAVLLQPKPWYLIHKTLPPSEVTPLPVPNTYCQPQSAMHWQCQGKRPSIEDCQHECLRTQWCQTITYDPERNFCDLNAGCNEKPDVHGFKTSVYYMYGNWTGFTFKAGWRCTDRLPGLTSHPDLDVVECSQTATKDKNIAGFCFDFQSFECLTFSDYKEKNFDDEHLKHFVGSSSAWMKEAFNVPVQYS